jgi:hypothetical protein
MDRPLWSEVLSRVVPHEADDLDPLLSAFDPRRAPEGRDRFPRVTASLPPQTAMKRADAVHIGLRVPARLPDAADRAMRLLAFAAEQDVEVVVLSEVDVSGLERFGFRCERIAGDTPDERAGCEEQILRFWNIDLVL